MATGRILVVDDDWFARQVYTDGLQREGYTVESAEDGEAAVALLRQHTAANDSLNDHEYRSAAALCRYLRLTHGLTGILEVTRSGDRYRTAEPSADRYRSIDGLAWAPANATTPLDYTRGTVAAYDAWANGEVYGYTVVAPDGRDVASCWDFYADPDEPITADAPPGLATMVAEAREEIDHDVEARTAQANTIGSGFIGLI